MSQVATEIHPDGSLVEIVAELLYSQLLNMTLSDTNSMSWLDMGRFWVEKYTQQKWEWWPLRPMQATVEGGRARLHWRCVSLQLRSRIETDFF